MGTKFLWTESVVCFLRPKAADRKPNTGQRYILDGSLERQLKTAACGFDVDGMVGSGSELGILIGEWATVH
jgi:hypothetical protein